MKIVSSLLLLIALASVLIAASDEILLDPIPKPVTNNAVASYNGRGGWTLYSFMGLGGGKDWKAVTNATYAMVASSGKWKTLKPVPGTVGRLGAVAVPVANHIVLFGGYVMDAQGGENTIGDLNIYSPSEDVWLGGPEIPTPVSAAIAGPYLDRYAYLIGGWSKTGPTQAVQLYDVEKGTWQQATPYPGPPVFGHAGTVVGDTIIYVDGAMKNPTPDAKPAYIASDECWMGKIDRKDPTKIQWTKLPPHPGTARFRIAAGGSEKDEKIYFSGGAATPYDSRGQGFDGQPATPSPMVFAYNLHSNKWEVINDNVPIVTMDQRGVLVAPHNLVLLGGMADNRAVTAHVTIVPKQKSH